MQKNLKIKTQAEFLALKAVLNQVQDVSFQYMQMNKRVDLDTLGEEDAKQLISLFTSYINNLYKVLKEAQKDEN